MPEKSWSGISISSGSQLHQFAIGIPASGFSPVPLVTDYSSICPARPVSIFFENPWRYSQRKVHHRCPLDHPNTFIRGFGEDDLRKSKPKFFKKCLFLLTEMFTLLVPISPFSVFSVYA
jgi:hypothetical protein